MKKEIIDIIRILGIGMSEIIIDMKIGDTIFNSIEYVEPDILILHTFDDEFDIETNWDSITNYQKKMVLKIIRPYLYN
jgi:hypothetical protein